MIRFLRLTHFLLVIILVGCSSLAPVLSTPTPAPVLDATSTPQVNPTATAPAENGPPVLRIWLPPQFDPNADTRSAELLKQRLDEFEMDHAGLQIEVRIKAGAGDLDIIDFLSATDNAAPTTMPDLIALSYDQLQTAVSEGFLHPLDGLTDILQEPDWYVLARELGSVQNAGYGIPFAADALITVYRPSVFEAPPPDWQSIIDSESQIVFAFTDTQAYFPLSLYSSVKDRLTDEQGVFTLDEDALIQVLSFYQEAYESGLISPSIKTIQSDADSLSSFRNGGSDLAVIWASSDIGENSGNYTPLLSLDNVPHSIGDGWVWALAGSNGENQPLAMDLAAYLVESEYMSEWTYASGYLPTRPRALDGWEDEFVKSEMNNILLAAHPIPSADVVSTFGPLMHEALTRVFNGEQADVVARSVIESLK